MLIQRKTKLEAASQESYVPLKEGRIEKEEDRTEKIKDILSVCLEAGMEEMKGLKHYQNIPSTHPHHMHELRV